MTEQDGIERVHYGPWFAKFAVSVSWRVLTGFVLSGRLTDWPRDLHASAETALRYWREFMLDQRRIRVASSTTPGGSG